MTAKDRIIAIRDLPVLDCPSVEDVEWLCAVALCLIAMLDAPDAKAYQTLYEDYEKLNDQ